MNLRGRSRTMILNPEKRKVGGSTPPLTTSFELMSSALTITDADSALSHARHRSDVAPTCHRIVVAVTVSVGRSHAPPVRRPDAHPRVERRVES
jgi:hypothetical protein